MKKNKKKIIIISSVAVLLVALIITGVTYAFFTASATRKNTFTMGDVEITLTEPNYNDTNDGKNLVPGSTLYKDPTITATAGSSYARMIVEIRDTSGNLITDADRLELIKNTIFYDESFDRTKSPITSNLLEGSQYSESVLATYISGNRIERNYNSTDFTYDTTRSTTNRLYYNYKGTFTSSKAATLFTNIVIPTDYSEADITKMGSFRLVIQAQAIQSAQMASQSAAYTALDSGV